MLALSPEEVQFLLGLASSTAVTGGAAAVRVVANVYRRIRRREPFDEYLDEVGREIGFRLPGKAKRALRKACTSGKLGSSAEVERALVQGGVSAQKASSVAGPLLQALRERRADFLRQMVSGSERDFARLGQVERQQILDDLQAQQVTLEQVCRAIEELRLQSAALLTLWRRTETGVTELQPLEARLARFGDPAPAALPGSSAMRRHVGTTGRRGATLSPVTRPMS